MLLAMTTAQRAQTLHAIYIDDIVISDNLVMIPIKTLLKQSTQHKRKFSIHLKKLVSDPELCVVKTLECYLNRTKSIRKDYKQLFISFKEPHNPVSKDTISRWIKSVLREAGIDIDLFKAHSTRAAACSSARENGVPIDEILKTAGWANNKCFQKFYDKAIIRVD